MGVISTAKFLVGQHELAAEPKLSVFCSYAHRDEKLRSELEKQLSPLLRGGQIAIWHDRQIVPGTDFDNQIDCKLATSRIILLLVSPDFLNSDYCYRQEMHYAIARHHAGSARVIPIILRPCDWQATPFGHLLALPKDGKPVTSWVRRDEALFDVAKGVRRVVEELLA